MIHSTMQSSMDADTDIKNFETADTDMDMYMDMNH